MPTLLVNQVTSDAGSAATGSYATVDGLTDTQTVDNASDVLLVVATLTMDDASGDACFNMRLSVAGSPVGPTAMSAFKDNSALNNTCTIVFAVTGHSGSTNFKVEWQTLSGSPTIAAGDYARSLQVIAFTSSEAEIITDISSVTLDSENVGTWKTMDEMTSAETATSGKVYLFIANVQMEIDNAADDCADMQFSADGGTSRFGPILSSFIDYDVEGSGSCLMAARDDLSGSITATLEFRQRQQVPPTSTARTRTFQVIEFIDTTCDITAADETVSSAAAAGASWADITGLQGDVTPNSTDSVLLFIAVMTFADTAAGDAGQMSFAVDDTNEGPEALSHVNFTEEVAGWSLAYVKQGWSGSKDLSCRWIDLSGTPDADTGRARAFQVIDFKAVSGASDVTGTVTIPSLTLSGTLSSQELKDLAGGVTIPSLGVFGALSTVEIDDVAGTVTIPMLTVTGSLDISTDLTGVVNIPALTVSGTLTVASEASNITGTVTLPAMGVAGALATEEEKDLAGTVSLPVVGVSGTLSQVLPYDIEGAVSVPVVDVTGTLVAQEEKVLTGTVALPSLGVSGDLSGAAATQLDQIQDLVEAILARLL